MTHPSELADILEQRLARRRADERIPGIVAAVWDRGDVVWRGAAGLADLEHGVPAAPDVSFRIASITKTFVAAAVLRLRDAGALSLDDPVRGVLGELEDPAITVRGLLSHTAGVAREFPGPCWELQRFPTRAELVAALPGIRRILRVGERFHYSNLGYALLAEVVARLTGVPFVEHARSTLLEPLGLSATGWEPRAPHARGYYRHPLTGVPMPQADVALGALAGAGQLWTTADDLVKWAAFFAAPDPGVLAPSTVADMAQPHVVVDAGAWTLGWGLGLALYRTPSAVYAGHRSGIAASAEHRVAAVAIANAATGPDLDRFAAELCDETLRCRDDAAPDGDPSCADAPPADVLPLLGTWWLEGNPYVFSCRGARVEVRRAAQMPDGPASVLEPVATDRFRTIGAHEHGEGLEVVRGADREVAALRWAGYRLEREPEGPAPMRPAFIR